ncbi:MAG: hypothetical protein ACREJ4_17355 [Candidatus Methylomirabilaceae bacterium]
MGAKKCLDLVATDGRRAVRLVKLSISGDSGIYGLLLHRSVKMHRSYHRDGTVHLKADGPMEGVKGAAKIFKGSGYSHDVQSGPPLDSFTGHFSFLQGIFRIDPDCFEGRVEYKFKKTDRLLIVDSRTISGKQRFVNFYLDLVEAGSYQTLSSQMADYQGTFTNADMICEHHCYLEFVPWILVTLAYSSGQLVR